MYNSDTELLFPSKLIPTLKAFRGKEWKALVSNVTEKEPSSIEYLAFVLMVVRLAGCSSCNPHSYRAIKGCTQCSQQTIRRFRGSDGELIEKYFQSEKEVEEFIKRQQLNKKSGAKKRK